MHNNVRSLSFGCIWFFVHYENNNICAVEEHDWHCGGHVPKQNKDQSWEDFFIECVKSRIKGDNVEQIVRKFLNGTELRVTI